MSDAENNNSPAQPAYSRRGLLRMALGSMAKGAGYSLVGQVAALGVMSQFTDASDAHAPSPTFYPTLSSEIKKMTQSIEARIALTPSDKPLFVLMGEHHNKPAHRLAIQGVIVALREKGYELAVGMELPQTLLTDVMLDEEDNTWVQERQYQRGGYCSSDLKQNAVAYVDSDQGLKQLLKFLSAERIPMRNNDLQAWGCGRFKDKAYIAEYEEINEPYFRKVGLSPMPGIDPKKRTGMFMRNLAMVDAARAHAIETGARIYIQHTGAGHLYGAEDLESPYKESLHALFKQGGDNVLSIDLGGYNSYSPECVASLKSGEAVRMTAVPDASFDYEDLSENAATSLQIREGLYIKREAQMAGLQVYQQPPGYGPPPPPKYSFSF